MKVRMIKSMLSTSTSIIQRGIFTSGPSSSFQAWVNNKIVKQIINNKGKHHHKTNFNVPVDLVNQFLVRFPSISSRLFHPEGQFPWMSICPMPFVSLLSSFILQYSYMPSASF